jgi:hypothetical protein
MRPSYLLPAGELAVQLRLPHVGRRPVAPVLRNRGRGRHVARPLRVRRRRQPPPARATRAQSRPWCASVSMSVCGVPRVRGAMHRRDRCTGRPPLRRSFHWAQQPTASHLASSNPCSIPLQMARTAPKRTILPRHTASHLAGGWATPRRIMRSSSARRAAP